MRRISFVLLFALTLAVIVCGGTDQRAAAADGDVAIVIHGGAGTILKSNMTPEREAKYRGKLTEALETGYTILGEAVRAWTRWRP